MKGGADGETFVGGAGDDLIVGGGGIEVAAYERLSSNYAVGKQGAM
jgi:hypothetical protein